MAILVRFDSTEKVLGAPLDMISYKVYIFASFFSEISCLKNKILLLWILNLFYIDFLEG